MDENLEIKESKESTFFGHSIVPAEDQKRIMGQLREFFSDYELY
jgi:hypothetical protein